ncbi:MAG: hypothetical protein J6R92_04770 [Akkermansia sp.]|nr:hypothetical protein [Akkermansia sp.]
MSSVRLGRAGIVAASGLGENEAWPYLLSLSFLQQKSRDEGGTAIRNFLVERRVFMVQVAAPYILYVWISCEYRGGNLFVSADENHERERVKIFENR